MSDETVFVKEELEQQLPEASDVEVLRDKVESFMGFNVKPWGFDEIESLTPIFEMIFIELKKRKLATRDFYLMTKDEAGKTKVEILNFEQLYFIIMPHLRQIFKITLHLDDEKISTIQPDQMMNLLLKIILQNIGYLKNWLALAVQMTARVIA